MKINTFRKEERLCNKRLIELLFHEGSSFIFYPFRITFLPSDLISAPAQVIIAVPKRRFKRAVDRNLLKRRIREAYRLNKKAFLYDFLVQKNHTLLFSIQYIGKEIHDFAYLETKLISTLGKLQKEYDQFHLAKGN